ncbi:MAG: hypothetical protein JO356_14710 [Acidobacteria bacterium]|nr:hypothetical protein [Acidobacteriota bacterium]
MKDFMATKQQWTEVFRNYEALARGMVVLREMLELRRQNNEQPTGSFVFACEVLRWFDANP